MKTKAYVYQYTDDYCSGAMSGKFIFLSSYRNVQERLSMGVVFVDTIEIEHPALDSEQVGIRAMLDRAMLVEDKDEQPI